MENNKRSGYHNRKKIDNSNSKPNNNNQVMRNKKKSEKDLKQKDNGGHKKIGINARNEKAKYSDDEIAKARYVDSKAKFLVRDRIHNDNIDTRNKWIGISNLQVKDRWDRDGNYDPEILSFDAEIFDRTEQPIYDEDMTEDEKHKLTYEVAEGDIQKQRSAEKRTHKKVNRPSYHVDVATKHTKDRKTEYQVKDIKRKK